VSCVKGSGWGGKRAGAGRKRDPLVADRRRRKEQLRIATALLELARALQLSGVQPASSVAATVRAARRIIRHIEQLELALDPSLPAREASRTVAAKRMLANLVEPN